jgi:hypothetical protein
MTEFMQAQRQYPTDAYYYNDADLEIVHVVSIADCTRRRSLGPASHLVATNRSDIIYGIVRCASQNLILLNCHAARRLIAARLKPHTLPGIQR